MASEPPPALPKSTLLLFALPAIMQGFMHGPATNFIQGIYATHGGLELTAIGAAVLFTRVFDAVTDPIVGYASDRTFERWGTRKPWIAIGVIITTFSLWQLYRPPDHPSVIYFTLWFSLAYLGWTITEIPYRAWSIELTSRYDERTRISTWIAFAIFAGTIGFFAVPIVGERLGLLSSQALDLGALGLAAIVIAMATPLLTALTLATVPSGRLGAAPNQTRARPFVWTTIVRNPALLRFILIMVLHGAATGMIQGVTYLFIGLHLNLAEKLPLLLLYTLPVSFLAIPFWGWACGRFQKHRAWAVALAGSALAYFGLSLVPRSDDSFTYMVALNMVIFFFTSATWVAPPAILGDVVDLGRLKFSQDLSGTYFGIYTLLQKTVSGVGVAASLYLIAVFGFDAQSNTQTTHATFGLLLAMSYIPTLIALGVAFLVWIFPLTRERHSEVLRQLAANEAGDAYATHERAP